MTSLRRYSSGSSGVSSPVCQSVARNIGLDSAPGACLTQAGDVKGFVRIEIQAFQAQLSRFEQFAQLGKNALQLKCVVLVASFGRGNGQRQP